MNRDELALRLLSTFLIELEEQTQSMMADTLSLESSPGDAELLNRLFRGAHTLKGAAHTAGVPLVQQACHALESRLSDVRAGHASFTAADVTALLETIDALADASRRLAEQRPLDDSPLAMVVAGMRSPRRRALSPAPAGNAQAEREAGAERAPGTPAAAAAPAPDAPLLRLGDSAPAHVRIDPRKFDALLASAGEVVTASRHIAARRDTAAELQALVARVRARAQTAHAGDTGWTRELLEVATRMAGETLDDARLLSQASESLSASTRAMRMRPFLDACEGLPRTVRDLAATTQKQARLELTGTDAEVDRAVLDRLRPALTHLIRNAVAHGIETPDVRTRNGKPAAGTVTLSARVAGDRVIVKIADDGAGLDLAALRARFGAAAPVDEEALARLAFEPGLSTRGEVSDIAGRGVGLDAARDAVESVRGRIEVASQAGAGTTFTIETPLSLSLLRVVVVDAGGERIALPASAISALVRVPVEDVGRLDGTDVLTTDTGPVPVVALAPLLGFPLPLDPIRGTMSAVLLDLEGKRLALVVDRLVIDDEVLMRPLNRIHPPIPLVLGGALHGQGEPILVLDPALLVEAGQDYRTDRLPIARADAEVRTARVLVADDSLTTRTLLEAVLHGAGYHVTTAPDGTTALSLIRRARFDLLVSDVEMPGMTGFDLCREVRRTPGLAHLPIILVTALETAVQRAQGLEAGADAYLTKSSFDQQVLLERVRQLLA